MRNFIINFLTFLTYSLFASEYPDNNEITLGKCKLVATSISSTAELNLNCDDGHLFISSIGDIIILAGEIISEKLSIKCENIFIDFNVQIRAKENINIDAKEISHGAHHGTGIDGKFIKLNENEL